MHIKRRDLLWRLRRLIQQTSHQDSVGHERLGELQGEVGVEGPQFSSLMQLLQTSRGRVRIKVAFGYFPKSRPYKFLAFDAGHIKENYQMNANQIELS